jgi:ORF6N domain
MFKLTRDEITRISQFVIFSNLKFSKNVYAFTQEGVAMLSSVLNSPRAIRVNIEIMRAFVRLRQILASNAGLERRLNELEKKYDAQFKVVFDAIRRLMVPLERPSKKIGFHLRERRAAYGRR